jgi:hypothetical protein
LNPNSVQIGRNKGEYHPKNYISRENAKAMPSTLLNKL